ncbi:MAG: hypothetical protein ACRDF4_06055 [Rhabdochlamydiaceae bacterium]
MENEQEHPHIPEQTNEQSDPLQNNHHVDKRHIVTRTAIIIVLILCAAVLLIFKYGTTIVSNKITGTPEQTGQVIPTQSADFGTGNVLSGHLQKITTNLGLLLSGAPNNAIDQNVTYYKAGTYIIGAYKGYTRYIVVQEQRGPAYPQAFIFATKDQEKYILDGDPGQMTDTGQNAQWLWESVDKRKISAVAHLPSEQPETIPLNTYNVLWRDAIISVDSDVMKKDYLGNDVSVGILQTDFSSDTQLK